MMTSHVKTDARFLEFESDPKKLQPDPTFTITTHNNTLQIQNTKYISLLILRLKSRLRR